MKAVIQFILGIDEEVSAEVRLTRSRDGSTGTATFYFEKPNILNKSMSDTGDITGMFMIDEEGTLVTRDINARYINGRPQAVEAIYVMKNREAWDRFMRFMERYSSSNNLSFTKSNLSTI
jgi:photosystem II protein